jgi:S1-C subfamily serine protease
MPDFETPPAAQEFYRRSQDELSRLYSRAELDRQVRAGLIAPDELVQLEGAPIWQPVRVVVGAAQASETAVSSEEDVPSWAALWHALARRLGREFENPSPRVVCVFLAIGALGIIASRLGWWLWLPWFVLVLVAAGSLMRAGRWLAGIPFAAAALLIPFFLAPPPQASPQSEGAVAGAAAPQAPVATPPRVVVHPYQSAPVPIDLPPPAVAAVPPASTPSAARVATSDAAAPREPIATAPAPKPLATPVPAPANPEVFRSGALVIVRDEHGAGSGFIAEQDGKRYLFTNAHVAAGMKRPVFTLLDGSRLVPVAIEAAAGHDIMRFALKDEPAQAMEIAKSVDQSVRIDDEVIVYGNSGGGGVVTSLPGRIVGIGPDRIEVSSAFIPGNSGSPIIHVPTGRVLGVATYLTKKHEEYGENGGPSNVIRRYGYRLDSVKKWEPVNWQAFQVEADRVEKISQLTEDIFNFLEAVQKKQQPLFATETLRKPAEDWRQTVSRRQLSLPDRRNATQSFLSSLRFMVRTDVVAAESNLHYSFFREKLQKERLARDELYKAFDTELARMSTSSLQAR